MVVVVFVAIIVITHTYKRTHIHTKKMISNRIPEDNCPRMVVLRTTVAASECHLKPAGPGITKLKGQRRKRRPSRSSNPNAFYFHGFLWANTDRLRRRMRKLFDSSRICLGWAESLNGSEKETSWGEFSHSGNFATVVNAQFGILLFGKHRAICSWRIVKTVIEMET